MERIETMIYKLIRNRYGKYARVRITVTAEGMSVETYMPTNIEEGALSMRDLQGEWIPEVQLNGTEEKEL